MFKALPIKTVTRPKTSKTETYTNSLDFYSVRYFSPKSFILTPIHLIQITLKLVDLRTARSVSEGREGNMLVYVYLFVFIYLI